MMSVVDIQRRRETLRSRPPGFIDGAGVTDVNNSSKQRAQLIKSKPHASQGDIDHRQCVMPVLPALSVTRKEPRLHMMTVIEVGKRRTKSRAKPPGFYTTLTSNLNNNSKDVVKSDKKESKPTQNEGKESDNKESKKKHFWNVRKEKKSERAVDSIDKSKPPIKMNLPMSIRWNIPRNTVKTLTEIKRFIVPKARKSSPEHYTAPTITVELAGEAVTVNILKEMGDDHEVLTFRLNDKLSPENYEESFQYYDDFINKRLEILKALYVLGDMLLKGELDGDKEEWETFTEKCATEDKEWKKRCRENKYSDKTDRDIRQDSETLCRRAANLLQGVRHKTAAAIKKTCPCCPC